MTNWTEIPVGAWTPDQPDLDNPGCAVAFNVVPRTLKSYGPAQSFGAYADALTARCQGAFTFADSNGAGTTVAGDATKLYRVVSGSLTPDNASRLSGGDYATPGDGQWRFCISNGLAIATNFTDAVQQLAIEGGTDFALLDSAAPNARYCADVKGFLMLGNTNDGTDGPVPYRVWWSALNDPTDWPTPGSSAAAAVQSDYNDMPGNGGWVQGLAGNLGSADVGVFMERAVWRGVYVGPPAVFNFFPAVDTEGCIAPNSIVQLDNFAYYLGERGFQRFDGAVSQPISDQRLSKTFFNDWDASYPDRIWGAVDPANRFVFWAYPRTGSGGLCTRLLCYAPLIDRWSLIECSVETICRTLSYGYTLEGLDSLGYTLETLPYSLDSRVWTGNQMLLSGFNSSHQLGYFNGSTLAASVETTEKQVGKGRRMMVRNARPMVDGGNPTVAVATRERLVDAPSWSSESSMNATGLCPLRKSGRYARGRISMPAGDSWTHMQGVEVDLEPLGER